MLRSVAPIRHPFKGSDSAEPAALNESASQKIKTQLPTIRSVTTHFSKIVSSTLHLGVAVLLVLQLDGLFIGTAEASVGS